MIELIQFIVASAMTCILTVFALKIKQKPQYDGIVTVTEDDGTKTFSLEPYGDLYDLDQKTELRLKVKLNVVEGTRE